MNTKRIYLIGYMACGKTNIGKLLAKSLDMQFVDLDAFIENRYHKTIDSLFSEKGEEEFRKIERNTLIEISQFENVIISTGGGTPCFYNNLEIMLGNGKTIYLKVSPDELMKRLKLGKNKRPLIKDKTSLELKEYVVSNLKKREAYYNRADLIFNAEQLMTKRDVMASVSTLISLLS